MEQSIKEECEPERRQNEFYGLLPQKEQPEICSAMIPTAEAHNKLLQCSGGTNNQNPVANTSAMTETNSHKGPQNTTESRESKNRFSPLLTFRRRVKKKINLDEPADENCSPGNDIQCSTLTHSQPNLSTNDTPLLKCSAENPLDTEDKDKVCFYTHLTQHLHNDLKWHGFVDLCFISLPSFIFVWEPISI